MLELFAGLGFSGSFFSFGSYLTVISLVASTGILEVFVERGFEEDVDAGIELELNPEGAVFFT